MNVSLKVSQRDPSASLAMTTTTQLFLAFIALLFGDLPPPRGSHSAKPDRYFNDYAHVVSPEAAIRFNEQLAQFERDTSNQVVVAVYPKMESDSSIDDYTQRIAQAWGVGQTRSEPANGVVLLVFMRIARCYAGRLRAEGALPDVTAFDITYRHIKPKFRLRITKAGSPPASI